MGFVQHHAKEDLTKAKKDMRMDVDGMKFHVGDCFCEMWIGLLESVGPWRLPKDKNGPRAHSGGGSAWMRSPEGNWAKSP